MAFSNGNPDSFFIARARTILRDQGVWTTDSIATDGTTGVVGTAGSKPFRLQRAPVVNTGAVVQAPGGPYAVVYDTAPAAGQIEIVTDTGEVIFNTAPAAGTLSVTYQFFRYADHEILDALNEGLAALWPEIWEPNTDTSIVLTATGYEYTLPAALQDPYIEILRVELAPPSPFPQWFETSLWQRVSVTTLAFSRTWPPGTQCRITYNQPFNALADPPAKIMWLPVYYAIHRILADQEVIRSREGDLPPLTGEGAFQPGTSQNSSQYWLSLFQMRKAEFARPRPVRTSVPNRFREQLLGTFT